MASTKRQLHWVMLQSLDTTSPALADVETGEVIGRILNNSYASGTHVAYLYGRNLGEFVSPDSAKRGIERRLDPELTEVVP